MPTIPDLKDLIRARYGDGAVNFFNMLLDDPDFAAVLHPTPERDSHEARVDEALHTLGSFSRFGLNVGDKVAPALREVLGSMLLPLGYQLVPAAETVRRPQEEGLLDAAWAMIRAFEQHGDRLPVKLPFDLSRARVLCGVTSTSRQVVSVMTRSLSFLVRSMARVENELHQMMDRTYGLIRPLALGDLMLSDILFPVERYFFEKALEAVKTRRVHEVIRATAKKDTEQELAARARNEARRTVTDEMKDLLQDFIDTAPQGTVAPMGRKTDR